MYKVRHAREAQQTVRGLEAKLDSDLAAMEQQLRDAEVAEIHAAATAADLSQQQPTVEAQVVETLYASDEEEVFECGPGDEEQLVEQVFSYYGIIHMAVCVYAWLSIFSC